MRRSADSTAPELPCAVPCAEATPGCGGLRTSRGASGEAGIGKTSLVERFLARAKAGKPVRIGRGNCVEQAGPGEAYLPVLQALQQLCRAPNGEQVVAVLRRYAPLWLLQLS